MDLLQRSFRRSPARAGEGERRSSSSAMKGNSKKYRGSYPTCRRLYSLTALLTIAGLFLAYRAPLLRFVATWRAQRTLLRTKEPANSAPLRDYILVSDAYIPQGDVQTTAIHSMTNHHHINSQQGPVSAGREKKRTLLCVTFVMNDEETLERVLRGLIAPTTAGRRSVRCDTWLLASYGGPDDVLEAFAKRESKGAVRVEVIKNSGGATRKAILKDLVHELKKNEGIVREKYNDLLFPKTLLLCEVLKSIRAYERVWLMDNDLSLEAFDMDRFFSSVDKAFGSSGGKGDRVPLLLQPLIAGSTQTYSYLNHDTWSSRSSNTTGLLAIASGFIEMQMPLIDAVFLDWFITYVVKPSAFSAHILGADWGLDSLFCSAAKLYAASAGRAADYDPCAIVIDSDPVNHLDLQNMNEVLGYGPKYALNRHFMHILEAAFPQMYLFGNDKRMANPMSSKVRRYYK